MANKNLHFLGLALLVLMLSACQKEPSTGSLHRDFVVYTAHDTSADFAAFETYFLPDSILLIGGYNKPAYWKDADAQEIIATMADALSERGFVRVGLQEEADLGFQISYVEERTYFVGANYPYWWWYYPYYWSPTYWGDWSGWHYPFPVVYDYTTGSLLVEALNLVEEPTQNRKLPIVWDSFMGGLLTASEELNLQRTLTAVEQAFEQSPYLTTTANF